jgi:hypothetical protein
VNSADQLELAARIREALEEDFTDRRGLKQEWERIDDEVKAEIRRRWEEIIFTELAKYERG